MATEPANAEDLRQPDRRVVVLETRFDTILPTLATKADLAELKGELLAKMSEMTHSESTRITRRMIRIAIAMFVGFGGMFATIFSRLPG